jgi:hypothetical protein
MRLVTRLALATVLPVIVTACSSSPDARDPVDAGITVQDAVSAFVDGFNSGDALAIQNFLAPASEKFGTTETLDAARSAIQAFPEGSEMSIVSFEVVGMAADQSNEEVVVSHQATIQIVTPDDTTSVLDVTQDVGVRWIDGRWLITGADPAGVTAGQPGV